MSVEVFSEAVGFRVIIGISEDTEACHIVRATLDAVCFQTRDILEAMIKDYGSHLASIQVRANILMYAISSNESDSKRLYMCLCKNCSKLCYINEVKWIYKLCKEITAFTCQ